MRPGSRHHERVRRMSAYDLPAVIQVEEDGPIRIVRLNELYADTESGVLAGAVAVGPDAASWMGEITLAIRAKIPVTILADVVHAFPTYGEALETALRALDGTGASAAGASAGFADQEEEGIGPLSELDMETPEDDAIEQHQELVPDETMVGVRREVPFDVNEADAAEQDRAVGYDDDDYR